MYQTQYHRMGKNKDKMVTGYVLYSREMRERVAQTNRESNFEEIRKIVNSRWRSLPTEERQIWNEKALKINEEIKAKLRADFGKNKNKVVTGYTLFSREVRQRVLQTNHGSNFEEISIIAGNEWRSLTTGDKQSWEEKAMKLNDDTKAQLLFEMSVEGGLSTPMDSAFVTIYLPTSPPKDPDFVGIDWAEPPPKGPVSGKNKKKVTTGYLLYSREARKRVKQTNPESNFGEISRMVGNEWRSLPTSEKESWSAKALKLNEENKA